MYSNEWHWWKLLISRVKIHACAKNKGLYSSLKCCLYASKSKITIMIDQSLTRSSAHGWMEIKPTRIQIWLGRLFDSDSSTQTEFIFLVQLWLACRLFYTTSIVFSYTIPLKKRGMPRCSIFADFSLTIFFLNRCFQRWLKNMKKRWWRWSL